MIALVLTAVLAQAAPSLNVRWSVPVEGTQRVGNREVQLTRLDVDEPPDVVLARYAASFEAAGLYLPPPSDQVQIYANRRSLTALDPISLTSYTVTVWPAEKGGSQVISSSSVVVEPAGRTAAARDLLPPNAARVFETRDEGYDISRITTS